MVPARGSALLLVAAELRVAPHQSDGWVRSSCEAGVMLASRKPCPRRGAGSGRIFRARNPRAANDGKRWCRSLGVGARAADTASVRLRSVEDLVRAARLAGVRDERVLDAVRAVPRVAFVPLGYVDVAYRDVPLPIPHGQVTTQPSLVARMVEAAEVHAGDQVLEVGAGYGWQTALLTRLAARVWSVERLADIAQTAREN